MSLCSGGYFFSFLVTHLLNFILSIRRLLKIVGPVISVKTPLLALAVTACSVYICCNVNNIFLRIGSFLVVFVCLLFLLKVLKMEDVLWLKGVMQNKADQQN